MATCGHEPVPGSGPVCDAPAGHDGWHGMNRPSLDGNVRMSWQPEAEVA